MGAIRPSGQCLGKRTIYETGFYLSKSTGSPQSDDGTGEFDFENSHWPSQFHHAGPFHDGKGREEVNFPWERLTGEPLIYASMGTILNGQAEVFRTIATGVAKHKGVQLVLSIGDQLEAFIEKHRKAFE